MGQTIPIAEIFGPTIQGEGPAIGTPSVFVRVGGCDYRCSWCDTMYAVDPAHRSMWLSMSAAQIVDTVDHLCRSVPVMVVLSGGNPALYDGLQRVVHTLKGRGHQVAMETQGSAPKLWLGSLDLLVISPKGPSSGQPWTPSVEERLGQVIACALSGEATVALKFVVGSEEDYRFAKRISGHFPERAVYLQPMDPPGDAEPLSHARRYADLVGMTLEDRWLRPVVLPRAHVLVWGSERGR